MLQCQTSNLRKACNFRLMIPAGIKGNFSMTYRLPAGMTCTQCVIQWKYHAGKTLIHIYESQELLFKVTHTPEDTL